MAKRLRGVFPILATPFKEDDRVDEDSLRNLVDFEIEHGVDGMGLAYGSEIPYLTEDERIREMAVVANQIDGRVPLVVNCDHNSTVGAVMLSRRAEEAGADAVMIMPPANVPHMNDDSITGHYEEVSKATTVPIFIQEAAKRLSTDLVVRLATQVARVRYIKAEVAPTPLTIRERKARLPKDFTVFGGASGGMFVAELRNGAEGTMPHCDFPEVWAAIWRAWQKGDRRKAAAFHRRYLPFHVFIQGIGGGMTVHKEVLRKRGVIRCAKVRAPAIPYIAPEVMEALDLILEELGLLDVDPTLSNS